MKEIRYQDEGQKFIETKWEAYNGHAIKIYNEEHSTQYDSVLQECSPLIGGYVEHYDTVKNQFGIVGLREKLREFNLLPIQDFINKNKVKLSENEILQLIFQDFKTKYEKSENEAQLFKLIFTPNKQLEAKLKRAISIKGIKEQLEYNVVYYESPNNYQGKNAFYIIRERRIPILNHAYKKSERPDFMLYINGIPLMLIEYKTEDSGILESLKDFENKESYRKAPFKVALNDGKDVIFFSDIRALKYKNAKDNSFKWVHYLPNKKKLGEREYLNIEYLFEELLCQPQNMYAYCMNCCSAITTTNGEYLINGRIQQYYAIKDIRKTLINVNQNTLILPYNYEFAHAQRSGKTITMKLISYMIEKEFKNIFNTIYIYTPDLQIKKVLNDEFTKSGNDFVSFKVIETRKEYLDSVETTYNDFKKGTLSNQFRIFIVNMQKITDNDLLTSFVVNSNNVLNIIDEAHHGQSKTTAILRDKIFPLASNYLFTATGKTDMYAYYFPENNAKGFRNKFTISDAKKCKITVPVLYTKPEKQVQISPKLAEFTNVLEQKLKTWYEQEGEIFNIDKEDDSEELIDFGNYKVTKEIKRRLKEECLGDKIIAIADYLSHARLGLPFFPKAIVYVDSVEMAKKYIQHIQSYNKNNEYLGYRWGTDFSSIKGEVSQLNPGITDEKFISAKFEKTREEINDDNNIIDILIAVDKYQKGFDLPTLLITFLDTNISEPARMNQIYTRSATKYQGKNVGYCVDLTFEKYNEETFQRSLVLYDNPEDITDCFIDDKLMKTLKDTLNKQFRDLKELLDLNEHTFTSEMILQQVLNEQDLDIRKKRQYGFFFTTLSITKNLGKIGSPMFFKPFAIELAALTKAFESFKIIYADKAHPENHKILINTDKSLDGERFITDKEIKMIINDVLSFIKENNIKNIISFNYTQKEIIIDREEAPKDLVEKINKEIKKDSVQKKVSEIEDYLIKNHKDLYDMIKDMLEKITDDRSLIYEQITQQKLIEMEEELDLIKSKMKSEIINKYKGNAFLFWGNQVGNNLFASYGLNNEKFVNYFTEKIADRLNIIFPQIDKDFSDFNKTIIAFDMFVELSKAETLSYYLVDFKDKFGLDSLFIEQLKNAPKAPDGKLFSISEVIFKKFMLDSLKQYFINE